MAKPSFQMPQGLAPSCPQVSQAFLDLDYSPPQSSAIAPRRHMQQGQAGFVLGNFCRCFLSSAQDVTLGISATGEVETRAQLVAEPRPVSLPPHPASETGSAMVFRTGLSSSHVAPKPDA